MKISSIITTANAFVLGTMASASAGGGIVEVPEPMTAGLLAAGAAGLYALRKFRGK